MHTVWKSWGRVHEVFAKFWEGGYIGVVKIFGGGYTFLVFYSIFINKFCKNFGGRVHFYPPSPPPCKHLWSWLSKRKQRFYLLPGVSPVPATRSAFRKRRLHRNIFAESRSKELSHSMALSHPKELSRSDWDRSPLGVELAEVTSSATLERRLVWFYDAKYIVIYLSFS